MTDSGVERAVEAWTEIADTIHWDHPFATPYVPNVDHGRRTGTVVGRWFEGGRLNVARNCLDRHLPARAERVAVHWEGEPGDARALTYRELHDEVAVLAEALSGLGVSEGDRVALYLGWLPETVVAMLACARLGAIHVLVPVPLPPDAVADRLADVSPKVVVTQDAAWRHGVMLPLKARADEALAAVDGVEHTVVVRRTGVDVDWYEGDRWYHELVASPRGEHARGLPDAHAVVADHPLMVVHLSDRRGRPKAVVHGTAAVAVQATAAHRLALTSGDDDVLWCAVDLSWVTAQIHGVYGPLLCGGTAVMFEGMLDTPSHERAWLVVERYGVSTFLSTPSVWRTLRGWAASPVGARTSSLRYVVSAGERLDMETRAWLDQEVAGGRATVADMWGQTELGGAVLVRPSLGAGLPDAGLDVVDASGRSEPSGTTGELVLRHPWPALALSISDDEALYWHHAAAYSTSDLARREADGQISILGRMDPVISVSGQLVSATEVRDVLAEHPLVRAAEVVERADPQGGQSIVACVVVEAEAQDGRLADDLRAAVHEELGGLAQPKVVAFCESLPPDVPRAVLRRALWFLCADTTGTTLAVSARQLAAAVRAAENDVP